MITHVCNKHLHKPRGYLMLLAIVLGAIFLGVLGSLSGFVLSENRIQTLNTAQARALTIAEAGLEYYRWHLAHYPTDLQNGTGVPGPYTFVYNDPEGGAAGEITLSITGNTSCGETTSVDITSTGTVSGTPDVSRTIIARYARPSVGNYSYVLNADVWAGSDRVILGPYHSNYGIRMDGTANSSVTSAVATWNCTGSFGCNPTDPDAPGVTGNGPNQHLWKNSVSTIPFGNISADFGPLKTLAQTSGLYYPRFSSGTATTSESYWRGYRLTFNADGTVTVRYVDDLTSQTVTSVNPADSTTDWSLIADDDAYETRAIPADCGLIFVEDHVWLEGTIPDKVTVVAANVVNANVTPNIYLLNNVQYGAIDGSDGLTAIAANDVLISPSAPNTMTLNGIFIAQGGAFGINAYSCSSGYATKTGTLTILGTTVSNKRTGTKWTSTCSGYNKGFQNRIDSYDRLIANDPPPATPTVSDDYRFVDWREQ